MTSKQERSIEDALIDTVNSELDAIRSFCNAQFPYDVGSVIAVRMSRAIISAICRINTSSTSAEKELFSDEGKLFLSDTHAELEQLSAQISQQIEQQSENKLIWQTWTE